jgi:hypothetical protein
MVIRARTSLFRAWKVYWDILFPEEKDRDAALADWVMSGLVHFCPDKPFIPTAQAGCGTPVWLNKLDVQVDLDGARIGLAQNPQQIAPWFANSLIGWKPQWIVGHADYFSPFEKLVDTPKENKVNHDRWSKESYDALSNVTLRIGAFIKHELQFQLRIGHLQAAGKNSRTDADIEGVEVVRRLNDGYDLDILRNTISSSDFRPQITDIRISKGPFHDLKMKWPRSFEEHDIALFERMKEMIEIGQLPNVKKAAEAVVDLALRKGNMESAIERLQRDYKHWIGS